MTKENRWLVAVVAACVCAVTMGPFAAGVRAEIIENRDGQSQIATWWGSDSVPPYTYTLDFGNTEHVHSGPFALRIDYNKANDAGSPYSFISAMGRWNLRNFDYLSFWVYNNGGPLKVRLHLEDKNGNPWESNWAGIEPETKTTNADWENLSVDLTRSFAATGVDFSCIQQIMFIVAPGDTNAAGTLWLDDVTAQRSPNGAPLETFESDFFGWSAGGAFSVVTNTTAQFQNDGSANGLGQRSLQINWGVKAANYDNFTYTPNHDPAAPVDRIGQYTNFTLNGNNTFEAWVKSTTDNNMPILLKFTGSSGTGDVATVTYTGAGAWQKLSWNYSALSNIAAGLQTVWLFPYAGAADNGGTLYIDNMNLVGGSGPVLPLAPTGFCTTATVPDGDGVYTVKWSSVSGVTDYQLHESTNINFATYTTINTNGTSVGFAKTVTSADMAYYYRVASRIIVGGTTNIGSCTAPAIATVKTIPTAARRFEILDNFDGQKEVAAWWGSDPSAPYVYTQDFTSTQQVHSGTRSLRVDFDKANETNSPYAFFSAMGSFNLRNFDYLSFWVYNAGTPLRIKVRLEDRNGNPFESDWAGIYLQTRTAAADWENIVLDLTRTFNATNLDMTKITQVMFMVEPGSVTNRGTFWMDDIEFHRAPNSAPIEIFEPDYFGWSSGGPFTVVTNGSEWRNDGTRTGLGQISLCIAWTNKAVDYSNVAYSPRHDASAPVGRIGNVSNFAANGNSFVELWVKSATETNLPILLKFDSADVSVQTYTGTGSWQRLTWDYSGVPGQSNVSTLYLYPYPNQADSGGKLYIDDLNLIGGSIPAVPYAPTTLVASAVSTGAYTLTWDAVPGVTGYIVQESPGSDFSTVTSCTTSLTARAVIAKSPFTGGGTYYHRVCSFIVNGTTNVGSCGAPISVTVIPQANTTAEILDGFDTNGIATTWWAADGVAPYVYAMEFANTQNVHSGKFALKVTYNKANDANGYTFFSAMGQYNVRNYDYLSFWVYNTGTPLKVKVRLEDRNGNGFESDWAGINLQTKTAAADWENLVFDLTRTFTATNLDLTAITQVMFMIAPGSTNEAGEFWMDDLQFSRAVNSAPLEPFEADSFGWSAGTNFPMAVVSNQFHNDGSATGLGQQSLAISWVNKGSNYDNFIYQPLHDAGSAPAGRIGNYANFALGSNKYAELWVKSATETNMPLLLKFDDYDVGVQSYTGTGQWQRLVWNYGALTRVTNVGTVWFFPYPAAADAGGTIYLDDFNLIGGCRPPVPYAPASLRISAPTNGSFTVSWSAVSSATGYRIQESRVADFTTVSATYNVTTNTAPITKGPFVGGRFYYRVASYIVSGSTNVGSCSAPVSVNLVPQANLQSEKLDGFDLDGNALTWWAIDGLFPYAYNLDFANTEHVHSGGHALKVTYNKANDVNGYTFFSAVGQFNLRNYDYLSFWVYNTGTPLRLKVRLEDRSGNGFESDWAGITLQTKTAAADWENLVFDLTRTFTATNLDMTGITQVMFMIAPGSTNEAGEFWMDDIQFSRAVNGAPLEPFEVDSFGWITGTTFPIAVVTNQFHNDGSVNGLGQQALRVSWTNKTAPYDNFVYQPLHDAGSAPAGRIGNYANFARDGNNFLELWVKSTTETNMPVLLKFDDYDVGVQSYTGTGQWQRLVWDYSGLPRATNVSTVGFFPYPNMTDAAGTIYIDDLNLIGGSMPLLPAVPPNLTASRVTMGSYTMLWSSVSGATGYQLQESMVSDFQTTTATYTTTNIQQGVAKSPITQYGTFYYRVRSGVASGYGTYSKAIAVYVPQITTNSGVAVNSSYPTDCAEVDNLSVGLKFSNAAAYRITVTHPLYYTDYGTNVLNERGADFSQCQFTDRRIWIVGTNNGSWAEFKPSGFGTADVYYPIDNPMEGIDEAWSNCPQEINHDWMQEQFFAFTAHELGDVDLEYKIGSDLAVSFALINGTLAITGSAKGANGWVGLGTKVFNATTRTNTWNVPDFTWAQGVDTNRIWLRVLPSTQSASQPGSWGLYDYVELRKRGEAGDRLITNVFDNGNIVINVYDVDFWWRTPETMHVQVLGGMQTNCDFFTVIKRVPETTYTNYSQVMVMYQDGYVRLLPNPPRGVDWTPFGASVVLGASPDVARPFVAVTNVVIDPKDLSMDITFADQTSCHVEMWVDEARNVLDVSKITYNTSTSAFTRLRSMWVCDGKADLDRVETASGVYPIAQNWRSLNATWWQFFKESPTYHNTYCPDFRMEVMDPSPAFLVRQCEDYDTQTNFVLSSRSNGHNNRVLTSNKDLGSEATYTVSITQDRSDVGMVLRYADDDGGNNGAFPGNAISVYVDGQLKDQTFTENTAGWEDFELTPSLSLGTLTAGVHTIRIVVGALTFGCDLDEFQLISQPVTPWTKQSILTKQGEAYNSGTNQAIVSRAGAIGGQSVHVDQTGGSVQYAFTAPTATTNTYIQLRYVDDVGPTKLDLYLDGLLAARFPTEDGTSWTDWRYSSEMFLGTLTAGTHTLSIVFYPETYGADIDQFEIYNYTP